MTNKSASIPSDVFQKIVLLPYEIASSDFAYLFSPGDPSQLSYSDAVYVSNVMTKAIKNFSVIIDGANKPQYDPEIAKEHLIRAFVYFFDKGVEIVYNLRTDNEKGIQFRIQDLYSGRGGNQVPEYLQLKVTPVIPYLAEIFKKTIDYLIEKNYFDRYPFVELTELILTGGMKLGVEFCQRLDLNDQSELEKFMAD